MSRSISVPELNVVYMYSIQMHSSSTQMPICNHHAAKLIRCNCGDCLRPWLGVRPKRLNTKRAGPTRLLPGLAGGDLIFQWIGMVEYIPCYAALGSPTYHYASQQENTYWAKYQKADRASTLFTLWVRPARHQHFEPKHHCTQCTVPVY
jgi:hypothetical protein